MPEGHILESHGWNIHRIWSTDWFNQPGKEMEAVILAIEEAIAHSDHTKNDLIPSFEPNSSELNDQTQNDLSPTESPTLEKVQRYIDDPDVTQATDVFESTRVSIYQEADFDIPMYGSIETTSKGALVEAASRIVAIEGPIHHEEIVMRLRDLLDLERITKRVRNILEPAITQAFQQGHIAFDDENFYVPANIPSEQECPIRDRSYASVSLRSPEKIPPSEIRATIQHMLKVTLGASRDELILITSRTLGIKRTSEDLATLISNQIDKLVQDDKIKERGEKLYLQ